MLKQSAAAAVLDFAAGVAHRLVAVVGSAAAEIVDILVVAPDIAAVVVDILVHCADEHSPQTDSYAAATEYDILVLTNEFPAPAEPGIGRIAAAAFVAVAVGRIDISVALVDKMAVEAAVSVEYGDGVGSAAVVDFVAVAEVADADRIVDFAVAAESIGSVTVAFGFDTVDAEASAVVAAAALIATSDCVLGCSE